MLEGIKTFGSKVIFGAKMHSPKILFAVGVGAGVACVALTIKSTLKAAPVVEQAREEAATAVAPNEDGEVEENVSTRKIYVSMVGKVAKIFALPAICGAVSIASFAKCYGIMNNRLVDATIYGTAMANRAKALYKRVAEKYGEEVANELYYGDNTKKVTEVNKETGEVKEKVVPNMEKAMPWHSIYSFLYKNESYHPMFDYNQLECEEKWLTRKLNSEGYLLLTDVLQCDSFQSQNIELKGCYCGVGWISKYWIKRLVELGIMEESDYMGDGEVSFGIFNGKGGVQAQLWRDGKTDSVIIDFNVDGPIYTYIDAINKLKKCGSHEDQVSYICDTDTRGK